jgi:diacylglycerol kinase (ATP)
MEQSMVFEKRNSFTVLKATKNSLRGMKNLWQLEKAFRIEVYCGIAVIPLFIFFTLPSWLCVSLFFAFVFMIVAEALNSAIEATVDRISLELHDQSRIAKDMGSAAVGFAILLNIFMWVYAAYLQL